MATASLTARERRYGSAADLAAYAGVSVRTIRRMVADGTLRGLKIRRRLVIAFEDLDRLKLGKPAGPGGQPIMASVHNPSAGDAATPATPYVPPISHDELMRRNRAAVALLDEWATEGDEAEQRETMALLRDRLGRNRELASRNLFP